MRVITFYRTENNKCPVEDYLETLSNKQVEKVFFVLQLVESLDIVPRKFFIKLAEQRKKDYFSRGSMP